MDSDTVQKVIAMFQSSIQEQRQLLSYIHEKQPTEQQQQQQQQKPLLARPSKIKQPKTFSNNNSHDSTIQSLTLENQSMSQQLSQVANTIRKAAAMTSSAQIKPLLNRAIALCNNNNKKSNSDQNTQQSSKKTNNGARTAVKKSNSSSSTSSVHIEELHDKIRQ